MLACNVDADDEKDVYSAGDGSGQHPGASDRPHTDSAALSFVRFYALADPGPVACVLVCIRPTGYMYLCGEGGLQSGRRLPQNLSNR